MGEEEFEDMLKQLLSQDVSVGTEAFRDDLLQRCLAVLDLKSSLAATSSDGVDLFDSELGILAAAGDVPSPQAERLDNE